MTSIGCLSVVAAHQGTGWAAPMVVSGAMAATLAARVMKVPALAALAPAGRHRPPTALIAESFPTISLVESSNPPGVSS